jgi:transcriptional regulator with XRE-family HTH domain
MITLTGKIIGAGYKKSKQTIYKFLVIKGEYDGTDLEGQKIEVYGAVNKLDPVQKRTILTVTGDFGRSRKNNLPRFKIQSISDLSSRLELDDIETFSKYLGISDRTVNSYCNGKSFPSLDALGEICRILDVSSDFLIGITDNFKRLEDKPDDVSGDILMIRRSYVAMTDKERELIRELVQTLTKS